MIVAIHGETNDTWFVTTLLHGLEEWLTGFPSDELVIVTNSKTVRAMAEARSRVASVVEKAPSRPHAVFIINTDITTARLVERAIKLRIPLYQVFGGTCRARQDART